MKQTLSKSQFARWKGWVPSAVTKAIRDGRVILTPDGMVDVDASERMLALTQNPQGDGARARHEFTRILKRRRAKKPRIRDLEAFLTRELLMDSRAEIESHRAAMLRMEVEERQAGLADVQTFRACARRAVVVAEAALIRFRDRLDPLLAAEQDDVKRAELWEREARTLCEEMMSVDFSGADRTAEDGK
jgi:hypothetical protein